MSDGGVPVEGTRYALTSGCGHRSQARYPMTAQRDIGDALRRPQAVWCDAAARQAAPL
jgi:hypothetical protein